MSLPELLLTPLGWAFRSRRGDERLSLVRSLAGLELPAITVTSPAFAHGGTIPAQYCGRWIGANVSPPLEWAGTPAGTRSLLLLIEDIDVPTARPGIHTIALLDASVERLREGDLSAGVPYVTFVPDDRGRTAYVGPRPLPGHGPHHYRFHVLALDRPAEPASGPDALVATLQGHVLAAGCLEGVRRA
ncbi:YbhB/YbcL family Raf kinase inhibitor-like protein [Dactylosporangium sp. CS-033363]|uniref:YbhB/YbcL family Raf kinase inhibitor-like protein n=1 Tax=Dactylosporangium sp. CS-033363 TaxID=3239935 RepID=UPI003D907DD6